MFFTYIVSWILTTGSGWRGWFWENIMLKYVWLLTGDFGDLVICFHLFNFLVRFQEFFVAQPHLSNKMETPHDSPVSLTGKELKDGQMGLLHTRPKGSSWKNGGNMLEKCLPGMAWCFTVQIYSPKIYTYIYISKSQKKLSTTRAQCCRFVSQKTNLNNFVFSPRLDEFSPGDWGERLTCSPSLNVLCPGTVQLRLDLLISECRNHSRNQEFHF